MTAADTVLSLLFKKLHPLLEDTAHALAKRVPSRDQERLHLKLLSARFKVVEALDALVEEASDPDLREDLEELAANLTPAGETFQQSLILTQLCLEDAPATWLPRLAEGALDSAPWAKRLGSFQAMLQDPAQGAEHRWKGVDPDVGESEGMD